MTWAIVGKLAGFTGYCLLVFVVWVSISVVWGVWLERQLLKSPTQLDARITRFNIKCLNYITSLIIAGAFTAPALMVLVVIARVTTNPPEPHYQIWVNLTDWLLK